MFSKTLSAILRGHWAIDKSWAEANLAQIVRVLEGQQFNVNATLHNDKPINAVEQLPMAIHTDAATGFVKASRYRSLAEAPVGSVALIPIAGPIIKYNGECGEVGTQAMVDWVREADGLANISGILLKIDSPGGQVDGTKTLVDTIANTTKRTIAFVDDGMMASAAMWIGAAADEIYASQKTDVIGSIGVMATLLDYRGYFESKGIKVHEIYAPQSTDKNGDYHDALDGNYKAIQEQLKYLADVFIGSVKELRGDKIKTSVDDPFTGKTYFAEQAVNIGLIDGITTMEQAILKAAGEA